MTVNKPGDKFEQEADRMAEKVMRMPAPAPGKEEKLQRSPEEKLQKKDEEKIQKAPATEDKLQKKDDDKIQKAPAGEEKLQRDGSGAPAVAAGTQTAIQGKTGGGQPLSSDVRSHMEPRFNADFGNVRVHHDAESASLNNQLSARAFTYQNHIFFSRDQYQPGTSEGRQLLAHELTHTIQQGHAVQRSPQVSTTTTPPAVQRLFGIEVNLPGLQTALDWLADRANILPGYRLLTVVMGFNPINQRSVDRSAANMLRGVIELIPGGNFITQALDNNGVTSRAAAWLERKIAEFGDIAGQIGAAWDRFKGTISASDIVHPTAAWERASAIFGGPIGRLLTFIGTAALEILKMVKDAILRPLAALAQGTRGYDLLVALLGEDPVTGEKVQPSAEMVIGGFLKLINQDEIFENMKKARAIPRAVAWFQKAVSGVKTIAMSIPGRVIAMINSLTFQDVITVVGAFGKVVGCFTGIAGDFISFGLSAMWNLLEIIFDVLAPNTLPYLKRTGAALRGIFQNPMPFMGNLVAAAKLGLNNFKSHFWTHLKNGLLNWLTGALDGVYIPQALTLPEMGKFALSVLGITWAQIRGKIVRALGPRGEQIMQGLEIAFDVITTLITGGPAALWELIKQKLNDLKDQVINGIVGFVTDTIVQKAIPKLVSMFIPGAGFIPAIITIYDTIVTIKNQLSRIWAVVTGFLDSIVAIAAGNIGGAANRVEGILANMLSLAINFLAGVLGLGKVTDKINGVIAKLRGKVDQALDAGIEWIVNKAKELFGRLFGGEDDGPDTRSAAEKQADLDKGIKDVDVLLDNDEMDEVAVKSRLPAIRRKYKLKALSVIENQDATFQVEGKVNPDKKSKKGSRTKYVMIKDGKPFLRPKYRGSSMIRTRLYGSSRGYGSDTTARKNAIVAAKTLGNNRYWVPKPGRSPVPLTGPTAPTIDHDPPVVHHWNTMGRNTDQTTRRDFFTVKGAPLIILPQNENSSLGAKGAGTYRDDLGSGFKAPGEE